MALLYRAIWQERRDRLCDVSTRAFQSWLGHRGIPVQLPDEGATSGSNGRSNIEVTVRRALAVGCEAVQVELREDRAAVAERWTTRLTAIDSEDPNQRWLWVDLERATNNPARSHPIPAPQLTRELIDDGLDARVDQVRIRTSAHTIAPAGLAGLIRNQHRTLPITVFSEDPVRGFTATLHRANETAHRLAGMTQVMILTADNLGEFARIVDDGLAIWGGAARVYLPNHGPEALRPDRHRFVSARRMGDDDSRPAQIIASIIAPVATARRPPAAYDLLRRELRLGRSRNDAELLMIAEDEIRRLTSDRDALRAELAATEDDLLDTQVDLEESVIGAARLANQLQQMLIAQAASSDEHDSTADLALEPANMSEAIDAARQHLTHILIPDGVEHDLAVLDSHPSSISWGELTWRALRALHLYAEARWNGNFKSWCADSGHVWAWSASEKKLSMRESEFVETNKRLADQRRFPVDPRVDPSGMVTMWAHVKIAEGGGPLAPRIYFHDDTRGVTGQVHVGFIGPHRYTQNARTN